MIGIHHITLYPLLLFAILVYFRRLLAAERENSRERTDFDYLSNDTRAPDKALPTFFAAFSTFLDLPRILTTTKVFEFTLATAFALRDAEPSDFLLKTLNPLPFLAK
jgi:hypothetical protein